MIVPPPVPQIIGIDSETVKIQAGRLAPPLVCLSVAFRGALGSIASTNLLNYKPALSFYGQVFAQKHATLVIHNAKFDLGVAVNEDNNLLFPVFDAYLENRICCTITLQKLIDIGLGHRKFRRKDGRVYKTSYSLADLIEFYYGEMVEKEDTWRTSYAFLRDIPVEKWPDKARRYAIYDAVLHLRLWEAQQKVIFESFGGQLPNQVEQQRASFVLHLMSMWGIRADAERVDYFIKHCEEEIRKMREALDGSGIFREAYICANKIEECFHSSTQPWVNCPRCGAEACKPNRDVGTRNMKEIKRRIVEACARMQIPVPMTEKGNVQTDKDTLEQMNDTGLAVLAESMTFAKHLGQWGPVLKAAVHRPVCCAYDELVETGRTSCRGSEGQEGTNIQNPPRKGDVRPAIVPREGWLFCSTDADTIELRAHAQNCLELVGWSRMAERLIEQAQSKGPDLHEVLGAAIVEVDPKALQIARKAGDVAMGDARQFAKIPNFGFPGGLGAPTFVNYAAAQLSKEAFLKWFSADREKAEKKAAHLREVWFETFPENRPYFKLVGNMIDREKGYGTVRQLMANRIRGGVRFTAAANGFFQGRVADAMKEVLWRLAIECYTGRETRLGGESNGRASILFGSRPVMFLHDEPILEHPEDGTESERAERQRVIVVETLTKWFPRVPCTSSAVLSRRWFKGCEPLFINKKLVPTKPLKDEMGKIKWVHDQA